MKNTKDLKDINQKILADGEQLPAVQLKDGTSVQTGTVATMLHNVKLYNAGERGTIEDELIASVPTLIKVGLFDLFPPSEWIAGSDAGRRLVGETALKQIKKARKQEKSVSLKNSVFYYSY